MLTFDINRECDNENPRK